MEDPSVLKMMSRARRDLEGVSLGGDYGTKEGDDAAMGIARAQGDRSSGDLVWRQVPSTRIGFKCKSKVGYVRVFRSVAATSRTKSPDYFNPVKTVPRNS